MLVLTRRPDQSIVVSCEKAQVKFTILRSGRDKVSIGVDAPPDVKILRGELLGERDVA